MPVAAVLPPSSLAMSKSTASHAKITFIRIITMVTSLVENSQRKTATSLQERNEAKLKCLHEPLV